MSYERVVVALDVYADAGETVMRRARQVCGNAEATGLYVVYDRPAYWGDPVAFGGDTDWREQVRQEAAHRLQALAPSFLRHVVLEGHEATEIHRYANEQGADLVVMGAHGYHGWRSLLGSTANAVLHGTACDVLCVHIPEEVRPYREVLVAVEPIHGAARTIMSRAVEVAAVSGARLSVVSVVQPLEHAYASALYADVSARVVRDAEERAQAALEAVAAEFPVTGERLVRHGYPGSEIRLATEQLSADLVVVGTRGRQGLGLLLGSTANAVLHGAKSDILAVRVRR